MARAIIGSPGCASRPPPQPSPTGGQRAGPAKREGERRAAKWNDVGRSSGLAALDPLAAGGTVRREAVPRQRLFDAVVKHADFADAARLHAAGDLAAEFA